jgi:hypothetical protein
MKTNIPVDQPTATILDSLVGAVAYAAEKTGVPLSRKEHMEAALKLYEAVLVAAVHKPADAQALGYPPINLVWTKDKK